MSTVPEKEKKRRSLFNRPGGGKKNGREALYQVQNHPVYNTRHHPRLPLGPFRNPEGRRRIRYDELFEFLFQKISPRPNPGVPFTRIDPIEMKVPVEGEYRLYWLGQSSCLLQTPRVTILTDPVFASRVSPIFFVGPKRLVGLPVRTTALPPIDYVVLSHNHYDHMDKQALLLLEQFHKPAYIVPLGVKRVMRNWGLSNIYELDWWQYIEMDNAVFHCTPARHFSGRTLADNNRSLWAGFVFDIEGRHNRFYFAGDTAYGSHFQKIGKQFPDIHMAYMPIGAYRPRRMMQAIHVNPEEAVRAFLDLNAEEMLAIHWGTYDLATEPILEPMERTRELAERHKVADRVHLLPIGGLLKR